jgi:hypothetical protein
MVSSSALDVKQDGSVPGIASKLYMSPRAGEAAWLTYHLINFSASPLIVNVNEIISYAMLARPDCEMSTERSALSDDPNS